MRRALGFAALLVVTSAAAPSVAPLVMQMNGRTADLQTYMRGLNGSPTKLGVISGGAATAQDNTNTATPFAIPRGEIIFVACDVDAFCIERFGAGGAAATSSYTSSAQGFPLTGARPYPFMMQSTVAGSVDKFTCIATAAWNCAVFKMD